MFAFGLLLGPAAVNAADEESLIKSPEINAEKAEVKEEGIEAKEILEKADVKKEEKKEVADESGENDDADEEAAVLYLKAQSFLENDITQKAEEEFNNIIKNYSGTWWAELSYIKLAGVEMKTERSADAIALLKEFAGKYPDSFLNEKADYSLCLAYVLNKDKKDAQESIKEFIKKYPDSKKIKDAKNLLKQL
ncbi:tetratricopeptide repeat protein [bacterium]|nr:tetratricopeptide repeat protein [bacterium]